jgi:hypothetical protein
MMVPRRYSFRVYLLAFALALLAVATTSNAHPVLTAAEAEQMGTKTTANDTEDNSETNIDAIVRDRPRTLIGTTNNRANGNSLTLAEVEGSQLFLP